MSYADLKKVIYVVQTCVGGVLLALGIYTSANADLLQELAAWLCICVGGGLLFFGGVTVLLWDDMDVLR